jgi:hypothetical protein
MNNPSYRDTGWPGVCNVVNSTAGDGTLITTVAGHSIVIVGASIKGEILSGQEVTLKATDASGTILVHLNENSGLFPGRVRVPVGEPVYLDGNVSCTLWYYIETP